MEAQRSQHAHSLSQGATSSRCFSDEDTEAGLAAICNCLFFHSMDAGCQDSPEEQERLDIPKFMILIWSG